MGKIKVGIIGLGSISQSHIKAYLSNPDVELYAFCDIDFDCANEQAKKYGVKHVFANAGEMLMLKELDAVSVCTWNSAHAPCAIAALEAGKHVLCEKPMALSCEQAQQMQSAAERNKKLLMIGFVRRFGNDFGILKEFADTGFFGDLYYAKATYLRKAGSPGGWFGDKSRSGGGPLIDLGVHVLDFVRCLAGNPRPVSVYGATFHKLSDRRNIRGRKVYKSASATENDIFDVEDMATALIRFDNGLLLSLEISFSLNTKKDEGKIEIFGTKGGAKLDPYLEIYSEINDYIANIDLDTYTALNFDGLFENEINHFISCIQDGIPCKSPASDGVEIMRILDAVYESARTGHEVIIKE